MKSSRNSIGGLTRHFERYKNENGDYLKFGNQDIDISKTHLNYNLADNKNQLIFIKKRTSEIRCLNRDDVKVMCSWVITLPKEIKNTEEQNLFFKESYNFLENEYKKENVISSYVHLDETTPHMHFAFVPVTKDKKKGDLKVSAKEVITRQHLKEFHTKLDNHMKSIFNRDIGILNQVTQEGNKAIHELKRDTAQEKIKKVELEASKIVSTAKEELHHIKYSLSALKKDYDTKKSFIEHSIKSDDMFSCYPDYLEIKKKNLLSKEDYVFLPRDKFDDIYRTLKQFTVLQKENQLLEDQVECLNNLSPVKKIKKLEKENSDLKTENDFYSKNYDDVKELKFEKNELKNEVNVMGERIKELNSFNKFLAYELEENKDELLELRKIKKEYKLLNKFLDRNGSRDKFESYKIRVKQYSQDLER